FNAALTINGTAASDSVTLNALTLGNARANSGAVAVTAQSIFVNGKIDTTAGSGGNVALTAARNIDVNRRAGIKTSSGTITLQANTAGMTAGDFNGISVTIATIESSTGAILLQGHGGNGSGTGNIGVDMQSGAKVTSTGASAGAAITLDGTGGTGT